MARFWKRGTDRSIEQLLRANRPEPTREFASSILSQITASPAPATSRRTGSPRRFALALALTVVALSIAAVLGGISAASAGLGGIAHIATKAVSPAHTKSTTLNTSSSKKTDDNSKDDKGKKGNDNNGDKDDKGGKCGDGDNDADDKDCGDHDGDHHQYKVGVCHWANHKYVLIFVSQQGAANHLKNHPKDKLPVNGHC
ncbi:MAG: hypothetical protein ACTHKS_05325 [Gaiellaceae bacterium]